MNVYIGWVIEISTGHTAYTRSTKVIVATDEAHARDELISLAEQKIVYNPLDHHPLVYLVGKLPESLG